jgi:acyl-homoserine-lactone acylase
MKTNTRILTLLFLLPLAPFCAAQSGEKARWDKHAKNVSIIRDNWGIAHIYGKTDADTVFGMEYTQAEDEFNRVETNSINAMGRLAETEG